MKDLAVVTSACGGYAERYLGDWARSLLAQTSRPGFVGIFTHGPGLEEQAGRDAAQALRDGGIRTRHEHARERLPLGTARNRAVALCSQTWVMHLDADDELLPFACSDIRTLATREVDIVAAGYVRSGKLEEGPRNREKLYKPCPSGQALLNNPTPCSGVSPFRRALWEQSPYRSDLLGGWDTGLWIGFGHLGAKSTATHRPIFRYRQHADSIFNTRRKGGFVAHLTGIALQGLRVGWRGVSVLVPRGDQDNAERVAAWEWNRARLQDRFPDWEILEGWAKSDGWRKGMAVSSALARARGATVIVLDGDCALPSRALQEGVERVLEGSPWVVPHSQVHRLGPETTLDLLGRDPSAPLPPPPPASTVRAPYLGFPGGGAFVVSRWGLEASGGIPSAFLGWGCEDEALGVILDGLLGPHERLPYDLTHFWHPPQARQGAAARQQYQRNRALLQRIREAAHDRESLFHFTRSGLGAGGVQYWSDTDRYPTLTARQRATREEARAMSQDRFRERAMALSHHRREGDPVAGALEMRRAYARKRKEQEERNRIELARQEEERKALLEAAEHKARLRMEANKAPAFPEAPVLSVAFASTAAAEQAHAAGLLDRDFQGMTPASPKGFTAPQVRAVVTRLANADA